MCNKGWDKNNSREIAVEFISANGFASASVLSRYESYVIRWALKVEISMCAGITWGRELSWQLKVMS